MRSQRGFGTLFLLSIVVFALVYVFIAVPATKLTPEEKKQRELADFERTYVRTDPVTGCQYVDTARGITPRLDTDGKPICKKEKS